jgi:hypothetical protein
MCGASAHVSLTPSPKEARSGHISTAHKFLFICNSFVTHSTLRWSRDTGDLWVAPWFRVSLCGYTSPDRPDFLLGGAEEVGKKGTRACKTTEALWEIIAPPSNKRLGKAAGGGPADLTSLNQ